MIQTQLYSWQPWVNHEPTSQLKFVWRSTSIKNLSLSLSEILDNLCDKFLRHNVTTILYLTNSELFGRSTASSQYFLQLASYLGIPVIAWNADNSGLERRVSRGMTIFHTPVICLLETVVIDYSPFMSVLYYSNFRNENMMNLHEICAWLSKFGRWRYDMTHRRVVLIVMKILLTCQKVPKHCIKRCSQMEPRSLVLFNVVPARPNQLAHLHLNNITGCAHLYAGDFYVPSFLYSLDRPLLLTM